MIATLLAAVLLAALVLAAYLEAGFLTGILRFREDADVEAFGFVLLATWGLAAALTVGALATAGGASRLTIAAAIAIRVALILAIVFMFAYPFLGQLEGKTMTLRAVLYPLFSSVVPILYFWRGRGGAYPGVVDVAWASTFTFDIVSNDLHWYGTWLDYDDFVHFVNAAPYTMVVVCFALALDQRGTWRVGVWGAALLAFLVNAAAHAIWEMWEHYADELLGTFLQPGGMGEASANMGWSFLGAALGILLLWWW